MRAMNSSEVSREFNRILKTRIPDASADKVARLTEDAHKEVAAQK